MERGFKRIDDWILASPEGLRDGEEWVGLRQWDLFYEISNYGRSRNKKSGRLLRPYHQNNGSVGRIINSVRDLPKRTETLHIARAVYESWHGKFLDSLDRITFKDGDYTNTHLDNLELVEGGDREYAERTARVMRRDEVFEEAMKAAQRGDPIEVLMEKYSTTRAGIYMAIGDSYWRRMEAAYQGTERKPALSWTQRRSQKRGKK